MCVHVCEHIHTHAHTLTHIHTHTHTHSPTHTHTRAPEFNSLIQIKHMVCVQAYTQHKRNLYTRMGGR